jgi:ectoine hydroxylase-related dioxygenase (phytanoyl-CoA dioxygenase family)
MHNLNEIKKTFYRDGFVKIKKLFNESEIKKIKKDIENIKKKFKRIRNPNMHYTSDKKFNTIHNINKFIKSGCIIQTSKDKRLINIVKKILGGNVNLRNLEFFLKPKKTGKKAPVHQDNYYWNIPSKKALNIWIACSESNIKNGGLYYFVKSHKQGLIDHQLSFQPGTSQEISNQYLKKLNYKKFYPNLKPGDCVLHHCEVVHGSNKNNSNSDRIGLVMSFKSKKAKIDKKGWNVYQRKLKKNLLLLKK